MLDALHDATLVYIWASEPVIMHSFVHTNDLNVSLCLEKFKYTVCHCINHTFTSPIS